MFEKFGIGVLRGMKYDDLADLIDNAPELLGRKIGDALTDTRTRGGELIDAEDINSIELALDQDEAAERELIGVLIKSEMEKGGKQIRLKLYLKVLNSIAETVLINQRSILIRGFLHSPDCWTYWKYTTSFATAKLDQDLGLFRLSSGKLIGPSINAPTEFLKIQFVDFSDSDMSEQEILDATNIAIRKSQKSELIDLLHQTTTVIHQIKEFSIEVDRGIYRGNNDIEIPSEAPGIAEMIRTMSSALAAQDAPDKALFSSVSALSAEFKSDS